jgi:phage/plasmid primase-like uncharacterized protein
MTNSVVPLEEVESKLLSVDMSKLSDYVRKLSRIEEASNTNLAPTMMREFIMAQDMAAVMLARATQAEMLAKSAVDTAEAIALLDKSEDFFKVRGQKPTADMRKAYVTLDEDVVAAKELHGKAVALVMILKNRVYEFKNAFDAVRQIYRDTKQTQWEGM